MVDVKMTKFIMYNTLLICLNTLQLDFTTYFQLRVHHWLPKRGPKGKSNAFRSIIFKIIDALHAKNDDDNRFV